MQTVICHTRHPIVDLTRLIIRVTERLTLYIIAVIVIYRWQPRDDADATLRLANEITNNVMYS